MPAFAIAYTNVFADNGTFGVRCHLMWGRWWKQVHYPLLPVGSNLLEAVEVRNVVLSPGESEWDWDNAPGERSAQKMRTE